ncbi:MAG: hypothetical protein KatS3mg015_2210 [Fimbriimonadales bacterium]|nr:MAG: hypothetical protein KatS3mg015_2210 [Fimbriimonadales bacterium]
MRTPYRWAVVLASLFGVSAAWAQAVVDPDQVIGAAVGNTLAQPYVFIEQVGWENLRGNRVADHLTRVWIESPNRVYLEAYKDGALLLRVVADGSKVWRYDAVRNEYSFSQQPGTLSQTFQVMAAWSRKEDQHLLRLLAGSSNWLILPDVYYMPSSATINEVLKERVKAVGADWRGEKHTFRFDDFYPAGKMQRLTLEAKRDTPNGLSHTYFDSQFSYPAGFSFTIQFTPPPGAKPAADLPGRIGGG